jgi:hypothetical protein
VRRRLGINKANTRRVSFRLARTRQIHHGYALASASAALAVVFVAAFVVVFVAAFAAVFVVAFVAVFIDAAVFVADFIDAAAFATIAVVNPVVSVA